MKDIVYNNSFLKIESVNMVWSSDKKYYIATIKGNGRLILTKVRKMSQ